MSRTAVSELGERLWADDQDFAGRDLSEYDIAYGASPADTQSSTGSPSGSGPGRGRAGPGGQGPEDIWPDFKTRVTASYQDPSRAIARDLVRGVVADCEADSPSAIACFMDDFEACITHLRPPIAHRRATRTTNLLERLFVKERRRLKIILNAFGEKPVLKLMLGAMIRAAERWRAIKLTDFERRQMAALREELDQEYEAQSGPAKEPSKGLHADKFSSSSRT